MGKDKFKKRQKKRRLIRGEMTKRGISGREVAARLGITPPAVSKGCATSPRIVAGVPARLFGKAAPSFKPSASAGGDACATGGGKAALAAKSPLTPLYKGGEGEGDEGHRLEACATGGERWK